MYKKLFLIIICITQVTLSDEVCRIEEDTTNYSALIKSFEEKYQNENKKLQSRIDTLSAMIEADTLKRKERISILEEKIGKMEMLRKSKDESNVQIYKNKYKASFNVQISIIKALKKLKSQYSMTEFTQKCNTLSNPNSYKSYNENLSMLKEKTLGKRLSLPQIDFGNSVLNPIYAIVSAMVSRSDKKDETTSNLYNVLTYTTNASQQLNILRYDMKYLSESVIKELENNQKKFSDISSLIIKDYDYQKHMSTHHDSITILIDKYFENTSADFGEIDYRLNLIIDSYNKYVSFINQNYAYYDKFKLLLEDIKPDTSLKINEIHNNYSKLVSQFEKTKTEFREAYDPQNTIKQSNIVAILK